MKKLGALLVVTALILVMAVSFVAPTPTSALTGFPEFTYQGVAFYPSDMAYNPTGEFIFPTIIKASDHITNPLGTYYLYYAPHDAPGGVSMAYSNSIDGPWTGYSNNPVISNNWSPHYSVNHVSSPHIMWNSVANKYYMYYHGENSTTRVASSTDGINFTYEKIAVNTSYFSNISEASYARVFEYTIPSKNNNYIMMLMGNNGGSRKIYLAWSNDGLNWTSQTTPLISPNSDEGTNLSAPHYFPWNGNHYVAYHASSGNIHITEVGADFNLENHLGVLYDSDSTIDNGRSASPSFITIGTDMYMFYEQGSRLDAKIAYAKYDPNAPTPTPTPTPDPTWGIINDDLSNYTAGWGTAGTGGSATQNTGYVTVADTSTSTYFYITKTSFTPPTGAFTFEVRAKSNAANANNEFTVRSGSYKISLYLTHGTSGTAQNKVSSPTHSYTLDTTVYHTYRVVVHANYTYDLYVDGVLRWSGAGNLGTGTNIFKIGGDSAPTANMDVDYVKMGTGEILP